MVESRLRRARRRAKKVFILSCGGTGGSNVLEHSTLVIHQSRPPMLKNQDAMQ